MQIHVIGNAMDVGEQAPEITTDIAFSAEGAIKALLLMPTHWGLHLTLEEARQAFQEAYGLDPLALTPEKVADRLCCPGSHYFVERHSAQGIEEVLETHSIADVFRFRLRA